MRISFLLVFSFAFNFGLGQTCFNPWGLTVTNQAELEAAMASNPDCEIIEGSLKISGDVSDLAPLSNIRVVEGSLEISANLISLSGLENLNTIANLKIENNEILEDISALENLEFSNSIQVNNNPKLARINLPFIRRFQNINIYNNDLLLNAIFTDLDTIDSPFNGNITFRNNASLENISMPNLESVADNIVIEDNPELGSLNLDKLKYVKDFTISNTSLNELALPLIEFMDGNMTLRNSNITQLIWPNLKSVNGFFSIRYNDLLESIEMPELQVIGKSPCSFNCGGLTIGEHPILTEFNFPKLLQINFGVQIGENDQITSLAGIANANILPIEQLITIGFLLEDNPSLTDCNVKSICQLVMNPNLSFFLIDSNAVGCNTIEEIDCQGIIFGGKVFYDINGNGIQDVGENNISEFPVHLSTSSESVFPTNNGDYYFFGDDGNSYSLNMDLPESFEITTTPEVYDFVFETESIGFDEFDFGIRYKEPVVDGSVSLVAGQNICNHPTNFYLSYTHLSGGYMGPDDVTLRFKFDPLTSFESSSIPLSSLDQNIGEMIFENLNPYDQRTEIIELNMPTEMSIGDTIRFEIEAFMPDPSNPSQTILIDEYKVERIVLCSYDPNDKQVSPLGVEEEHFTQRDEKLTYTIRFQNTGNFPARNVEILDTIDSKLDIESFKVVASSHSVMTNVSERNVSFLFENIYLADSVNNEPESHGYVSFEISALDDNPDPTIINNSASIYFDSNPPIVTNTVFNTMVEEIPLSSVSDQNLNQEVLLVPNPSSGKFKIVTDDFQLVEICDLRGRVLFASENAELNLGHLESQTLIARVFTKMGVSMMKLILLE